MMNMDKALQVVEKLIESAPPLVSFETVRVPRAIELFKALSLTQTRPVYLWSAGDGLHRMDASHILIPRTDNATNVLDFINLHRHTGIFLLPGFTPFLEDAQVIAHMKRVMESSDSEKIIVLVDAFIEIPELLRPFTRRVRYGQQREQREAS
jgi:hypothetical protein